MNVIKALKEAAEEVGISLFETNSTENGDTQINKLTRESDLPLMMLSWDMKANVSFDSHGFVNNVQFDTQTILITKAEILTAEKMNEAAQEMGSLYVSFLQALNLNLRKQLKAEDGKLTPVINASYVHFPAYGAGKHSGVLGNFSVLVNPHKDVC